MHYFGNGNYCTIVLVVVIFPFLLVGVWGRLVPLARLWGVGLARARRSRLELFSAFQLLDHGLVRSGRCVVRFEVFRRGEEAGLARVGHADDVQGHGYCVQIPPR